MLTPQIPFQVSPPQVWDMAMGSGEISDELINTYMLINTGIHSFLMNLPVGAPGPSWEISALGVISS